MSRAGKQCTNCHRLNHFAKVCWSTSKTKPAGPKTAHTAQVRQQKEDLQDIDGDDEPDGTVYVIHATHPGNALRRRIPRCQVTVAGHQVPALIDTGASINILARLVFSQIPKCPQLFPTTVRVFACGSATPIPLAGVFTTDIMHEGVTTRAKTYVAKVRTGMLLSGRPAEELELVTFALSIHMGAKESLEEEYSEKFKGIGCLKEWQVKRHIDKSIEPVALKHRRIAFHHRPKVEIELAKLEEADIIERVEGPTRTLPYIVLPTQCSLRTGCVLRGMPLTRPSSGDPRSSTTENY
ncbi:hypothetical protein NDU88_005764 [Pleurodeles waltl]|uniref:Peptidase A2 domain-containing protein n=1 Tax=Pleurodeles waltl TaxID=8319 RepID=A0AAV7WBZ1_PLEWA|nr:hypothetical protein NDU88_005764 [Pleurodeles waltl]